MDGSTSGEAAAQEAIAIARRLGAPVVFVYVRGGPSSILGQPYYQRRLDAELARAARALDAALAAAERAGVAASGEVLEGPPARRLVEFADMRAARLVVLGPRRRRRFRRSVSRGVVRAADRPVMLASAADGDARDWVADLRGPPAVREQALADLHLLLLRGARFELRRRRDLLGDMPERELEGLAVEAATDALAAILAELDRFRGSSRFTTWAYKFVLLEAACRARREAWRGREINLAVDLPERLRVLRAAVQESLTPHQRDVVAALALNDVPIDVLAERLSTTRGELYATLRVARGTLREAID